MIPANCTDRLRPLDIGINKAVKEFYMVDFKNGTQSRCVATSQLKGEKERNLIVSALKPLEATWMIAAHEYISRKPEPYQKWFQGYQGCFKCIMNLDVCK